MPAIAKPVSAMLPTPQVEQPRNVGPDEAYLDIIVGGAQA
jgi:hypothetical protein